MEAYNAGHKRMLAGLASGERQILDVLLRKLLIALESSNGTKPSSD